MLRYHHGNGEEPEGDPNTIIWLEEAVENSRCLHCCGVCPCSLWMVLNHRFEQDETPFGITNRKTTPWVDNAMHTEVAEVERDNSTEQ